MSYKDKFEINWQLFFQICSPCYYIILCSSGKIYPINISWIISYFWYFKICCQYCDSHFFPLHFLFLLFKTAFYLYTVNSLYISTLLVLRVGFCSHPTYHFKWYQFFFSSFEILPARFFFFFFLLSGTFRAMLIVVTWKIISHYCFW